MLEQTNQLYQNIRKNRCSRSVFVRLWVLHAFHIAKVLNSYAHMNEYLVWGVQLADTCVCAAVDESRNNKNSAQYSATCWKLVSEQ